MRSLRRIASLCIYATLSCAVANSQTLQLPTGIAYDAAGNLYIADTNRNQVLEATLAGALLVVAGTGTQGFAGDNGPATSAQLNAPQGLAIGPDGTLYIADTANHRIRAVTAGQITTFAGTGTSGFSGDGSLPTAASFRSPTALTIDPTGALLVCDTGNHRIRRIANGITTTVAGNGTQGFAGDGGPATSAEIDTPLGIAAFGAGAFYFADSHNDRIRTVGLDGIIHTVTGTGTRGFSGEGGLASQAKLALPQGVLLTSAGLAFSDANNQRVRLLDSAGKIATLAGSGVEGKAVDGDATLAATIDTPAGVALSPFGMVTFADSANRMVRVVANNQLFSPAAFAPARTSTISTSSASPEVYGASSLTLAVAGSVGIPQGTVQLLEGSTILATASLKSGTTSLVLPTLSAGTHSLTATYLGDGLNPATAATPKLNIAQASSLTTESTAAQNAYSGLPLTLTAQVTTSTQGLPTGSVQFLEGSSTVATGQLIAGSVSAVYLDPSAGTHVLQAVYSGDNNFQSSYSSSVNITVQVMPDFALTSAAPSQTVQGGSIATYPITITSQPGSFSGAVVMSATGLPVAATVSFSPAQVVPGSGSVTIQMNISTPVTVVQQLPWRLNRPMGLALLFFAIVWKRRVQRLRQLGTVLACFSLTFVATLGCGSRSIAAPASTPISYGVTVTGTSTNLAGAVVMHTTVVQLTVR